MTIQPRIPLSAFPMADHETSSAFVGTPMFSSLEPYVRSKVVAICNEREKTLAKITAPEGVYLRWNEFYYRGKFGDGRSFIDLLSKVLGTLFTDFPERQEAMARAMGGHGYRRHRKPYVATTLEAIFPGKPNAYARSHSRMFFNGWWVNKAIPSAKMLKLLESAVNAAGLAWGHDVIVPMQGGKVAVVP